MSGVRLDKWLWAARFFKTRTLAKSAIDGGKVKLNGERAKPSREVIIGQTLTIRQGWDEKTIEILGLKEQRSGAAEAAMLYQETSDSITKREQRTAERKALRGNSPQLSERPTKKQRRQIHRFKNSQESDHN